MLVERQWVWFLKMLNIDLTAWALCNRQDNRRSALEWKLQDEDRRSEISSRNERSTHLYCRPGIVFGLSSRLDRSWSQSCRGLWRACFREMRAGVCWCRRSFVAAGGERHYEGLSLRLAWKGSWDKRGAERQCSANDWVRRLWKIRRDFWKPSRRRKGASASVQCAQVALQVCKSASHRKTVKTVKSVKSVFSHFTNG
jgi:hypothetical protein